MKKKIAGFTMLELIVVIAVLSILVTMAVPTFKGLMDKSRLKGAAELFYSNLQLAKSEAVLRNRTIFISVNKGANWCLGMSDRNSDCNCSTAPAKCTINGNQRMLKGSDFKNITLSNNSTMGNFSIKNIRGLPSQAGTAIFVTPDNLYLGVKLSPLGRAYVCSNPSDTNLKGISGYPTNNCPSVP